MLVTLSVIVAAIFVRLNRGMPTLEWKSLEPEKRTELTSRIVELSKEYVAIVSVNGFALISLVTLVVVGKEETMAGLSATLQKSISAAIGALFSLCLARMAYVVWRDRDIIELQKYLIDHVAANETRELEIKSAEAKLLEMKSTGVTKQPTPPVREL